MAYKRQIAYWDLLENGRKKGNAGFCKWEQREETHTISISIRGLHEIKEERLGVYTKAGGSLGELNLRNGRAEAVFCPHDQEVCKGLGWICIPLSQGRELEAQFGEEIRTDEQARVLEVSRENEKVRLEDNAEYALKENYAQKTTSEAQEQSGAEAEPEKEMRVAAEMLSEAKVHSKTDVQHEEEVGVNAQSSNRKIELFAEETPLRIENEDKKHTLWESFATTNEKMRPFGTEAEYYRIALEDIYRLNDACHMLRNNQFLLHGYYNYRYLILGRKEGVEDAYWLGVPGIYHEREKMAARMYGFEKFEGATRDYRVGDLGYYLISVR